MVSTGITKESQTKIAKQIITSDKKHLSKMKFSIVRDGKKFIFLYSDVMGYMYAISDEKDKSNYNH